MVLWEVCPIPQRGDFEQALKQVISIVITDYNFTPDTKRHHPVF
jgi:hypothetical protein